MKTWSDLLDALRQGNAYEGDGSLADVQKFLTDNDIKVMGDLAGLFNRSKKGKAVMVRATAGEEIQIEEPEMASEMAEGEDEEPVMPKKAPAPVRKSTPHRIPDFTPAGNRWASRIKQYERRANDMTVPAEKRPAFADGEKALAFAGWLKSIYGFNSMPEREAMKSFGIEPVRKAAGGSTFTAGGALIPEEFVAELIELKESYGVMRRLCRVVPMTRDVQKWPRLTDDITVYKVGENTAITDSQPTFDGINLVAEKWGALTQASSELLEDSALDFADVLMRSFARAFAKQEDNCIINGDGTATYFGVLGIIEKFEKLVTDAGGTWPTNIAYAAGVTVGSGNAYSEITIGDLLTVQGSLPEFAGQSPVWLTHKSVSAQILERLAYAGGGNTATDIGGKPQKRLLGDPIEYAQVMAKTASNSQIAALYGDFSQAVTIGDRRQYEVATSEERYFPEDAIAFRATQRIAINVHDLGNASATASARVAGPVVALALANS